MGLTPCPLPQDYTQRVTQQFERRAAGYGAAAAAYHAPLAARLVGLAGLRAGEAVLDVGAGTGLVALQAAAEVGPGGRVVAVDLSPAMLDQAATAAAAAGLRNLECRVADVDACAFPPSSFDAVLCSSALPFLPDIPASLARWRPWLRPRTGRLAFNVPKGCGSRAFSVFAAAAAQHGLLLTDPSAQFGDEAAVRRMLTEVAGYAGCQLSVTREVNRREGVTPQQWAEASWAQCLGMPFADLPVVLSEAALDDVRRRHLAAAAELADGWAADGGIVEPYDMLWVVAQV